MKPPQALLFDLDDTLIDEREHQRAVMRTCSTLASLQDGLDADRLFEANQEVWRAYWPEAEGKWTLGLLDGAALSHEVWRRTLRACGCTDESLANVAVEALSSHTRDAYGLYEDVPELLGWSKGRLLLGLITNGASDTQRERLRWFDLERHFDVIVISGEVGVAKPDAAIFGFALDQLAVPGDEAWFVGDSLHTDVAGAEAAGLTAVWLNRHGSKPKAGHPEPDLEIESMTELFIVSAETE
jgi:putative hydrolase of the HAD superfamily